jgi:hypothetical protein
MCDWLEMAGPDIEIVPIARNGDRNMQCSPLAVRRLGLCRDCNSTISGRRRFPISSPKHWRLTGRGEAFRAYIVNYADDFVILSQRSAAEALAWTKVVVTKLGLTLNGAKTSVKDARTERFDFLGYTSRGFDPAGYPTKPLVSYQSNRQFPGWILPPLVIRALGAHCKSQDWCNSRAARYVRGLRVANSLASTPHH